MSGSCGASFPTCRHLHCALSLQASHLNSFLLHYAILFLSGSFLHFLPFCRRGCLLGTNRHPTPKQCKPGLCPSISPLFFNCCELARGEKKKTWDHLPTPPFFLPFLHLPAYRSHRDTRYGRCGSLRATTRLQHISHRVYRCPTTCVHTAAAFPDSTPTGLTFYPVLPVGYGYRLRIPGLLRDAQFDRYLPHALHHYPFYLWTGYTFTRLRYRHGWLPLPYALVLTRSTLLLFWLRFLALNTFGWTLVYRLLMRFADRLLPSFHLLL